MTGTKDGLVFWYCRNCTLDYCDLSMNMALLSLLGNISQQEILERFGYLIFDRAMQQVTKFCVDDGRLYY